MKIFPLTLFHKTLVAVAFILLPILVVFLYGYQRNKEFIKRNALDSVSAIAEAYEGQVFGFIEMSRRRAIDFSSDGFIRDELKRLNSGDKGAAGRLNDHLKRNKIVLDNTIDRICVINLAGRVVASTDAGVIGNDHGGEEFFEKAKGMVTVAERFNKRRGVPELTIGAPLADKATGAPIGVIMNFVEFTEFSRILSGMFSKELGALSFERGKPATMEIYLVNKDKLMMTESKFVEGAPMRQRVDTVPVQRCLSFRQEYAGFHNDYRGVEVAGASMCLPDLGWILLVEVDTDEALAPVIGMQRDAIIAAGAVMALLGFFFLFFFRAVVSRLHVLSDAAVMMAKGDYGVIVPITSGDEIGMLSDSFNIMTREIQRRSEVIRESEDRLRAVVDNTAAVIYLKDLEGRYLLVNRTLLTIFKKEREDMIGHTDFDNFPEAVAATYRQHDLKVIEEKKAMEFEEAAVQDGGTRYYLSVKVPVFDAAGKPHALCGISTDITERKMREKEIGFLYELSLAIGASEDFSSALEAAVERICRATGWDFGEAWVSGDDYTLKYVNGWPADVPAYRAFIEKARGMTIEPGLAMPGRVWADKKYEWCPVLAIDGVIFIRDKEAKAAGFKSGAAFPVISGGRVLAVLCFFMSKETPEEHHLVEFVSVACAQLGTMLMRKLAEEQRAEMQAKYEGLVNNLTSGVFRCSVAEEGRFVEANPAAVNMLGAGSKDKLLEHGICDFFCNHGKKEALKSRLLENGEIRNEEFELTTLKGGRIWISFSAAVKKDKDGNAFCDGVITDITERKSLEDQLRQSQKIEAIGRLAGGVAHDFNNILTAMIGYGNLLLMKREEDAVVRSYAEHILTLSDKAAHLTQGLLAFSRKQVMNMRPVDVNGLVRGVEKLLIRLIGEDVDLKTDLFGDSLVVMADSVQIEQVLMNLATNSRDAMPNGGLLAISTGIAELDADHVSSHGYGAPGRYALITFSDSGKGMDAETRQRIFEPFFTTKEVGKGTGLGLSIAYGIIKQHSGYINVYSEPGKGTSFRIYLPLVDAAAAEVKAAEHVPVRGGSETILLAEDESEVREITQKMLSEFGYKVITAVDGEEAIAKFKERPGEIDLVMLDMVMPKKGGSEAYREITNLSPGVKVVFTSGYAEEMVRAAGLSTTDVNFISKPASPADILRKVREALDK